MQCQWSNNHPTDFPKASLSDMREESVTQSSEPIEAKPVHFRTQFAGYMKMYSDAQTVGNYFDAHQGWFCRCASPMKTEAMGNNGYVLTVGRFGYFGHEVEPKMAVVLESPKNGIYLMHSVPVAYESCLGYEVDYQASMRLHEIPLELEDAAQKQDLSALPNKLTKVEWHLQMDIAVQFPKVIHKLPLSLIQKTGDRLLTQIIQQISPRLTYKVQQDFHAGHNLPIPPKSSRHLEKLKVIESQVA